MRIGFLSVLFFAIVLSAKGQNSLGLEYQRNIECVRLGDYEDLVLSNSSYLLTKSKGAYRFAYGLEIQEAIKGAFGGLYVFGLTTDLDYRIKKLPLSLNINGFVGGGGGAGAPDGSGLAYRYAIGMKGHVNPNFNVLARYSNYNFPTGSIGGNQVQLGFSYGFESVFNRNLNSSRIAKQSVSMQGLFMNLDEHDSGRLSADYRSKFISVEYATYLNDRIEGLIRLQAAISSQIDGFMAYYSGLSYSLIKSRHFAWKLSSLLGSCGGGDMNTSGGLSYLLETGIDITSSNKTLSISRGYNASSAGSFSANYFQIGLKYHFESTFRLGSKGKEIESVEGFKRSHIGVKAGLEVHKAPNAMDGNGLWYEDMTLMHFGLAYPIHKKLDLLGETRWAMGGDYGAYAEGVIGLSTPILSSKKLSLNLPVQMVVAGGGGIDVGKGVGVQLNLSADYLLSETGLISFSIGKLSMIDGNYKPLSFNIGYRQNLFFYLK